MFIFQFLNNKIHYYVLFDIILNLIIQKLKKKHFPQKVYKLSKAKFSQFDRTRGEKNRYFTPYSEIWQYRLRSFQMGGINLKRFLPKNQHIQKKFLNFENWINGGLRSFQKSEFKKSIIFIFLEKKSSI